MIKRLTILAVFALLAVPAAAIGSTPRDVIAILQNLRSAGALEADVEVI